MKIEQRSRNFITSILIILLSSFFISLVPGCSAKTVIFPNPSWSINTPEQQGFDSTRLAKAMLNIRQKNLNIHSLLIVRNGSIILDAYFYPYDGRTTHRLASVTKSIMTALIAIAADQGRLNLDQSMLSFFPERVVLNVDEMKKRITVRNLAGMSSGLDSVGMAQDEGTLNAMTASQDYIQFALDRKVLTEPGTHFVYDSPSTHILSAILQKATGVTAEEFARKYLFGPLDIQELRWETDPQGLTHGWSDLFLKPRDVAKLGYLWLNRGKWGDKQIVSTDWVDASVKTHLKTGLNDDYGYGWWITEENPHEYAAMGRGGQRIQVYPSLNTVVVMTAGGVEYDEIIAEIAPAVIDTENPLKENPAGAAELSAAINSVLQPPAATVVPPLPSTARDISGKTVIFKPNAFQVDTVMIDFNEQTEATLHLTYTGDRAPENVKMGLDGVYRIFSENNSPPRGYRGYWADNTTFVFDYDDITRGEAYAIKLIFTGQKVTGEGRERSHEAVVVFEGKIQ